MKTSSTKCYVSAFVFVASVSKLVLASKNESNDRNKTEAFDPGPRLRAIPCINPRDCKDVDGTYCDADLGLCLCKPDYPVTDTNECYKESKYDEFCQLDIQCQKRDKNTKCNRDFNLCECQSRFIAQSYSDGQFWCVQPTTSQTLDTSIGSYVDLTLFGIMGGLALMFIVMCVVLRLFAKVATQPVQLMSPKEKQRSEYLTPQRSGESSSHFRAQFAENRSIFNTPNPRLMNVSLLKDSKLAASKKHKNSSTRAASISSGAGADADANASSSNHRKRSHASKRKTSMPLQENEDNNDVVLEMKDSQA